MRAGRVWSGVRSLFVACTAALFGAAGCGDGAPDPGETREERIPERAAAEQPRALGPAPFDVPLAVERAKRAFRETDGGRFAGGPATLRTSVARSGAIEIIPRHFAGADPALPHADLTSVRPDAGGPLVGAPVALETTSIARGVLALAGAASAVSVAADGVVSVQRGAVTETVAPIEAGLEQSWHFAERPAGDGSLAVRVAVRGYDHAGDTEGGLHFFDPESGIGFRYGRGTWIDADGDRTEVVPRFEDGAIVLEVPVAVLAASSFPAVLDPVISAEIGIDEDVSGPSQMSEGPVSVAFDGTNYMAVWTDGHNVLGLRIGPDGVRLDEQSIQIAKGNSMVFAVIAFDGTNHLVAWREYQAGYHVVKARFVSAAGEPLGEPWQVSHANRHASTLSVAFDGAHHLIVWNGHDGGSTYDVFGARVTPDGELPDGAGFVISAAASHQMWPSVAAGGGVFAVSWMDARSGNYDIYAARVSPAGGVIDTSGIPIATGSAHQERPAIAYGGGTFLVTWNDGWALRFRLLRPDGTLPASGTLVSGTTRHSSVAHDGGGFQVVYSDHTTSSRLGAHLVRVSSAGGILRGPTRLGPVRYTYESGVACSSGGCFAAWRENRSGGIDIFGGRTDGTGAPLDGEGFLLSRGGRQQERPSVASDGTDYLIAYSVISDGSDWDVYAARISATGELLDAGAIPLGTSAYQEIHPSVAHGGGTYWVTWMDARGGHYNLYTARVGSDGAVLDPGGRAVSPVATSQQMPSTAWDGDQLVVAWYEWSSGWHVRYRRLNADGSAAGSPTTLSSGTDNLWPRVGCAAESCLVAWYSASGGYSTIHARRLGDDGAIGALTALSSSARNYQPDVAAGPDGYLVAWHHWTATAPSYNDVHARRVGADGSLISGVFAVSSADYDQYRPAAVFDGQNYLVVWSDNRSRVRTDLIGSWVTPAGEVLDPAGVVISDVGTWHDYATLAAAADGRLMVAYRRFDPDPPYGTYRARARLIAPDAPSDTTPPVIDAVADVTAEAVSSEGAEVSYPVPGATDDVDGPVPVSCAPTPGAVFPFGATTVQCVAFDAAGNQGSASFTVTVVDTTAPVVIAPGDMSLEATGPTGAVAEWPPVSGEDAVAGTIAATCEPGSGSAFPLDIDTAVTCTAVDPSGNAGSDGFLVRVSDTTPPAIEGAPGSIMLEATGPAGARADWPAPSASDLVDGATAVTCTPSSGATFPLGENEVSCSAIDARGNGSSHGFSVTVLDTTAPAFGAAPADIVAEATGPLGGPASWDAPIATDIVGGAISSVCSPASGSTFPLDEATPVACTASDASGNAAATGFLVSIVDTTPPVITGLPGDLVFEATGPDGATAEWVSPTADDLVDGAVAASCAPASGSMFAYGDTAVTCSATDAHANGASGTFTVSVVDTTPPAFDAAPGDVTVEATGPAGAPVSFPLPAARDLRDGAVAVACAPEPGSIFPLGSTPVLCTAADAAGNRASTSFQVQVVDTTPPVLALPADLVVEATGPAGAAASWPAPSADDLVDGQVAVACAPESGAVFPYGVTAVTCSASDTHGNAVAGSFAVSVIDTTPPAFDVAPADVTAEASSPAGAAVSYQPPTATDLRDGPVVASCAPAAGSEFPLGTSAVVCTAVDAAGNAAATSFQVHVVDTTAPDLSLPAGLSVEAVGPEGAVATFAAGATDAVSGEVAVSCAPASGSLFPLGETVVHCSAADGAGNEAAGSFTVSVVDTTAPSLAVPDDILAVATSSAGAPVSFSAAATDLVDGAVTPVCTPASGSMFAPGATEVRCTATDAHGNTAAGTFQVQVVVSWSGVLQPVKPDGNSVFRRGRTVPIRFALTGESAGITDLPARLYLAKWSDGVIGTEEEAGSTSAADSGNMFRYTDGEYLFNLGTRPLSSGTWQLRVDLGDGVPHIVMFSVRD